MKSIARSDELVLVYITAPDPKTARRIARTVVEGRLAACANITGAIESIYWWKGSIDSAREVAIILKTRRVLLARLVSRVQELHPYETPCIVAYSLCGGHADFLRWLRGEATG